MTTWTLAQWVNCLFGAFCLVVNLMAWRHFAWVRRAHLEAGTNGAVLAHVRANVRRSIVRTIVGAMGIVSPFAPDTIWVIGGAIQVGLAFVSISDWWAARRAIREAQEALRAESS